MSDTTQPKFGTPHPNGAPEPTTATVNNNIGTASHAPIEGTYSLAQKLNDADRRWRLKGAIKVVTILSGLIGIGATAWTLSTSKFESFYFGYSFPSWPCLLTFCISVVWCALCILVLVIRKRPMHAGVRVAIDLLLWLALILTTFLAVISYFNAQAWGVSGTIYSSWDASNGEYHLSANGTWTWELDPPTGSSSSGRYSPTTSDTASRTRSCDSHDNGNSPYSHLFSTCAAQDEMVNRLWQQKPARMNAQRTTLACQFITFIAHFVLFVWACVDCYKRNRSKVTKDAEKLAADIVQTMVKNGATLTSSAQTRGNP